MRLSIRIVTLFAYFPLSLRLTGIKIKNFIEETIIPGFLPGVLGIASWIIFRSIMHPSNWVELGSCVFLGMIVYLSVLFLWCLQPVDRNDLQTKLTTIKLKLKSKNL
jgi:hypothetical protein